MGGFVERGLGDQLAEDLAVEAGGARLLGGDGAAALAAQLPKLVVVVLAELFDGDFLAADLGHLVLAKTAENVADAPDREADGQHAEHDAHDDLAEPGRGDFMDIAEHGRVSSSQWAEGGP